MTTGSLVRPWRRVSLPLALLVLSLASTALAQTADPDDPSTWSITACAVTNLSSAVQSFNLTLNLAPLTLLYLVLPASNASASLFSLDPNNPTYADTAVSAPPVSADEYLRLYSSATNASNPAYLNNTVIVAGALAADPTGAPSLSLSMYLPPSSVFTVYYLLANDSAEPPLYGGPLTQPASTGLAVPAACVAPPALGYCTNLAPTTLYPSFLDPYALDARALSLYGVDLALFSASPDCSPQQPNAPQCANCLAIRQRWRCATTFNGCSSSGGGSGGGVVSGGGSGGACRWLCVEKNSRCDEAEDCSKYPTSDCNAASAATSGGGVRLAATGALLCYLLLSFLW